MTTSPPGVFYQCQRCGNCCRWPGDVCIEEPEIAPIADHLGLSEEEFLARFTRLRANRQGLSLVEKPNHECVFLDGNRCTIQAVKPAQCSGFPNQWNFPGWQKHCEAVPLAVPLDLEPDQAPPSGVGPQSPAR